MAKNNLTPEQDLLTRQFFNEVAVKKELFPNNPAKQRQLLSALCLLLNYQVVQGKFVSLDKEVKVYPWGKLPDVVCEWDADTDRALQAVAQKNTTA